MVVLYWFVVLLVDFVQCVLDFCGCCLSVVTVVEKVEFRQRLGVVVVVVVMRRMATKGSGVRERSE